MPPGSPPQSLQSSDAASGRLPRSALVLIFGMPVFAETTGL